MDLDHDTTREFDDAAILELARALAAYLAKPNNRGAAFLLNSKGLRPADRVAILVAVGDLEDEPVRAVDHVNSISPRPSAPGDQALERALWFAQRAFDVLALKHGETDPDATCLSRIVARLSGRVITARDEDGD